MRGPGEGANAELKNWRILRKIRSSPAHPGPLVNAVQAVIINAWTTVTQAVGKGSLRGLGVPGDAGRPRQGTSCQLPRTERSQPAA